eukprot:g14868.t1
MKKLVLEIAQLTLTTWTIDKWDVNVAQYALDRSVDPVGRMDCQTKRWQTEERAQKLLQHAFIITGKDTWAGCKGLLDSWVVYGPTTKTRTTNKCTVPYELMSGAINPEWLNDPCCNWVKRQEQCCGPRTITERNRRHGVGIVWDLDRDLQDTYQVQLGPKCTSDIDCYTGECYAPVSNSGGSSSSGTKQKYCKTPDEMANPNWGDASAAVLATKFLEQPGMMREECRGHDNPHSRYTMEDCMAPKQCNYDGTSATGGGTGGWRRSKLR